jgi:tetratricopeptide (TPR) repeat protein
MPSHIFTRLGLWDESIRSNINSISAARCYAQNLGMKSHWDEELHGLDYLVYAYLQQARDKEVLENLEYLKAITEVFPLNFKDAYSFAAIPVRYVLERKDWKNAARLELSPANFPWGKFPWEKANFHFGRLLGAVHTHQPEIAQQELKQLQLIHTQLQAAKEDYKANQVLIQIKASEGWMEFEKGHRPEALQSMIDAAAMEDSTEKHPVTPGEVIPARELLGDMYMDMGEPVKALEAYESDLKRHPNRFNGLYGAGLAEEKSGNAKKATAYYRQLLVLTDSSVSKRPQRMLAESYLRNNAP